MKNEERILNIIFNRSGSGSDSTKIAIPIKWIRDMKIDKENKQVKVIYDPKIKEIKIKKYNEK